MWKKVLFCFILIISSKANSVMCQNQSSIILQASEMTGYVLKHQDAFFMPLNEGKTQPAIKQTWQKEGNEQENIEINYGVFNSIGDAYQSILFFKNSMATPFSIGCFAGNIHGDKSWFPYYNPFSQIIILRGNTVINVFTVPGSESNFTIIDQISQTILGKIENNITSDIQIIEKNKKESQISLEKYSNITSDMTKLEDMMKYSHYSSWDSKWFNNSESFVLGRRVEWKDDKGGFIGVDIAEFESSEMADTAKEIRIKEENPYPNNAKSISEFVVNSSASIDSLTDMLKRRSSNYPISGISSTGNFAIHIYHYAPYGNDIQLFRNVLDEVSKKISF